MYSVQTEKFEGPMELLLTLIEERKLSINEVSLSQVAEQYVLYLKSLEEFKPQEVASFLVVAATLMLIKSRSLLPQLELSQEEEADIKDLEHRLEVYRKVRELSLHIQRLEKRRERMFSRETMTDFPVIFYPPEKLELSHMLAIIRGLITALPQKEILPEQTVRIVISLEEKMEELRKKTEATLAHSFQDFVAGKTEKVDVIVSFLAMLELIKEGIILVEQNKLFQDIRIQRAN